MLPILVVPDLLSCEPIRLPIIACPGRERGLRLMTEHVPNDDETGREIERTLWREFIAEQLGKQQFRVTHRERPGDDVRHELEQSLLQATLLVQGESVRLERP